MQRFCKIHMVVNNAGVGGEAEPIEQQQQSERWHWAMNVNLMGVVFSTKVMTPYIKDHGEGGWVVNVASMAVVGGVPYGVAYYATKTAVVGRSERDRQATYQSNGASLTNPSDWNVQTQKSDKNGVKFSIVGTRLLEAINANQLYIFTHPEYRLFLKHRAEKIDAAFERAGRSSLPQHLVDKK